MAQALNAYKSLFKKEISKGQQRKLDLTEIGKDGNMHWLKMINGDPLLSLDEQLYKTAKLNFQLGLGPELSQILRKVLSRNNRTALNAIKESVLQRLLQRPVIEAEDVEIGVVKEEV